MKLTAVVTTLSFAFLLCATADVHAQASARGRLDAPRDPIMETNAKHSLDVARWYLTKRKAYEGARERLQEIVDTYPEFSRMDEVFYLLGEANFEMDEADKASEYYEKLLKDFSGSQFAKKARERLKELKPPAT